MIKIALIAGGSFDCLPEPADLYVGVDAGSLRLLEHSLPLDWAIGDFDSVTPEELGRIKDLVERFLQAPAEKDDTDLELAVLAAIEQFPDASEILILGGLGGRFDHEIQIFYLVLQTRFSGLLSKITLLDTQNTIRFVGSGRHVLTKMPEMTYLAFASLTPVLGFSIKEAKYELAKTDYPTNFSLSSNEFVGDKSVTIELESGIVAVIQARD